MFDNKKQPVEDMFSGTDQLAAPAPAVPMLTPPARPVSSAESETSQRTVTTVDDLPSVPRHSSFGILKVAFIVVIVLALVAGAAYAAYKVMMQQSEDGGIVGSVSDEGIVDDDAALREGRGDDTVADTAEASGAAEEEKDRGTFLDSDGDGLTNAEELEAGTSITKPDTDSDGLGDREEVEVYDTDPRNPDTDGDTYLDGQEVAGGYNPNGEGRLFNVPTTP